MTPDHARAARELLAFYAEAGVDALLGEEPVDRLSAAQIESAPATPEPRAVEAPASLRPSPPPSRARRRAGRTGSRRDGGARGRAQRRKPS